MVLAVKVAIPDRWLIVVPGGTLVVALGLGVGALSVATLFPEAGFLELVRFLGTVVAAPIYLVLLGLESGSGALPATNLVLAILALIATPWHAIVPSDWTAPLTIVGLSLWLLCELLVAGAPA